MPYHKGHKKEEEKMGRKKKTSKVLRIPFYEKERCKYSLMKHSGKFKNTKGLLYMRTSQYKRYK